MFWGIINKIINKQLLLNVTMLPLNANKHRDTAVRILSSAGFLLFFVYLTHFQWQVVYSSISLLIMNYERHFAY